MTDKNKYSVSSFNSTSDSTLFLTPKEVSIKYQISVGTLAVWRTNKRYPITYIKMGGKILYPENELKQWLSTRTY